MLVNILVEHGIEQNSEIGRLSPLAGLGSVGAVKPQGCALAPVFAAL